MPFLLPLIALIAGIIVGQYLTLPALGVVPILAACGIYLYFIKNNSSPAKALKINKKHAVWIFLLFFGIGIFDMGFNKPDKIPIESLKRYEKAEGEVLESKESVSGDQFIVKIYNLTGADGKRTSFRDFNILLSTEGLSAQPGDIITFPAKLSPIEDNPNFRSSGYASRMGRAGIFFKAYAKEGQVDIIGFNNSLSNSAVMWRNRVAAKIEKSSLSRSACDFIIALLLGDRTFLSEELRTTFSNAGVAHVLALSGLHVTIIMGIFLLILFPLKLIGFHILRYWIAILLIWAFAFFTGMSPSTVRACLMTTFVVAAMSMQRKYNPENALVASAFIILLVSPQSLFDIGLQLSFLCVGSILMFASQFNPVHRHYHPYLHSMLSAVLVSLIATVTTWVVISYYFNSVPLLFLPVNLCLLPLLPAYIWVAVIYIILLLFGIDFSFLAMFLSKGYDLFNWIATHLSAFGSSAVSVNVQLPVVITWLLGVLIIAYTLKKKPTKKTRILTIGGMALLVVSIISIPFYNRNVPDSIIFQKKYNEIALALYDGNQSTVSVMPRNSVSRIIHKGCEVMSIDCNFDVDSIASQLNIGSISGKVNLDSIASKVSLSRKKRKKYLILGSGFKGKDLKEIPAIREYEKIILHSSIKRKMETKLKQEALEIGLKSIHSLCDDGPLEEFLPDTLPTKN